MDFEPSGMAIRLREAREQADLSGRALAKMLGISAAQVSKMETGRQKIPVDLLPAWCGWVKITLAAAFGQEYAADWSQVPYSPHIARLYAQLPPEWQAHCQRQVESAHRLYRAQVRTQRKKN